MFGQIIVNDFKIIKLKMWDDKKWVSLSSHFGYTQIFLRKQPNETIQLGTIHDRAGKIVNVFSENDKIKLHDRYSLYVLELFVRTISQM